MPEPNHVSDATVYRMALYHCFLGELLRSEPLPARIRSRQLAEDLGIKEETVRRDLSYVGGVGRPGAGYDAQELFDALQRFLGLSDEYPIVRIGTAQMLGALDVVFPAESYGVLPVAYFSELDSDVGSEVRGIKIQPLSDLSSLDPNLGVSVALVACAPAFVQETLYPLDKAGVSGVLLLTPSIRLEKPEGMNVTHVRMPCDIKSLACHCKPAASLLMDSQD